jgi:ORF6N domain
MHSDAPESEPDARLWRPAVIECRGKKVMLAANVAQAFGTETRAIAQAIKRNPKKFDLNADVIVLTEDEIAFLRSQDVIPKSKRGGSRRPPIALGRKAILRLSTIFTTPKALAAADVIFEVFDEVYSQVSQGQNQITVANPSRLVPDKKAIKRIAEFRESLIDAMKGVLQTVINPRDRATVQEELGQLGGGLLDHFKAHLNTKSIENEKISADTLLVLEKVRELREKTRADWDRNNAEAERMMLENLDRKIAIVERLLKLADNLEPNAIATLFPKFEETITMLPMQTRSLRGPTI